MGLAIIGDVHGKYSRYIDICDQNEYTVQLGDTGYNNSFLLDKIDCSKHKFFTGNHNDHINDYNLPNCLGRFGVSNYGGFEFFFISGAFSIDKEIRNKKYFSGEWPRTWFPEEELSTEEMEKCRNLYEEIKPDILITHEAPRQTVKDFTNPDILKNFGFDPKTFITRTSVFLDSLWAIHKPYIHICGHYHKKFYKKYDETNLFILEELGVLEL